MIKTSAVVAVLVAAASSNAALITLGGDFSGTFGNGNLIAINSAGQRTFSQNLSDASVSGTVRFSNTLGAGDQSFELALDNFSYTSTSTQSRTLTIRIVQDFVRHGDFITASAQRNVSAFVNFSRVGQVYTGDIGSKHENTLLPSSGLNPAAVPAGSAPSGSFISGGMVPISVPVSGVLYTIEATYTITLTPLGGTMEYRSSAATSGLTFDRVALVPTPASAALLGLGGLLAARRRR
ncbi:MAG TPA: hypothetical protein VK157_08065 [Phycisphaerales bacterium]|nr:hypothetical protein [Phycisphaerales bacterium]